MKVSRGLPLLLAIVAACRNQGSTVDMPVDRALAVYVPGVRLGMRAQPLAGHPNLQVSEDGYLDRAYRAPDGFIGFSVATDPPPKNGKAPAPWARVASVSLYAADDSVGQRAKARLITLLGQPNVYCTTNIGALKVGPIEHYYWPQSTGSVLLSVPTSTSAASIALLTLGARAAESRFVTQQPPGPCSPHQ